MCLLPLFFMARKRPYLIFKDLINERVWHNSGSTKNIFHFHHRFIIVKFADNIAAGVARKENPLDTRSIDVQRDFKGVFIYI